ncbi:MAG: UDP-2,4-diacetamido-2,4,6-trideoxy-beta-L-altropyranose hydrolase [Acetatifactor sp.]|nr:UDP-2,4-diacetamido-2,4,6-trideoxy-beta-L-altropyranose hydrolase [Acetatifactor sp.]
MYVIRADGNAKIGAGHLMRCLTIAEALAQETDRNEILFFCADELSAELVRKKDFAVHVLGTDYRCMELELPLWKQLDIKTSVILVDSYFVTDYYLRALRQFGVTILLDDMQEDDFPVDAVINYNAFAEEESYRELYRHMNTKCYIGAAYVPLRPQFVGCAYQVQDEVQNILITTGGGDVDNIAGAILEKVVEAESTLKNGERLNYHLIIGKYNPHLEELKQRVAGDPRIFLHCDVEDMAGLMQRCDLAITAGGTTVYELAALGVPFVCFSYAENQERLTHYVGEQGIAGYAGAYHRDPQGTLLKMQKLLKEYCTDKDKRIECYLMERAMVDGGGARRIAKKITAINVNSGDRKRQ